MILKVTEASKYIVIDEEMSISELQELMNENEKFLLGEIAKLKSQGKVEKL